MAEATPAPMGSYTPATPRRPVITLYRRVVEQACGSREELQDLVHDVVVERTAEMLGVPPESLDPVYRRATRPPRVFRGRAGGASTRG